MKKPVVTALSVFLGIQIVPLALGAIIMGPKVFAFLLEPYVWIPNAIVLTVAYVLSNEKLTPTRPRLEDSDE